MTPILNGQGLEKRFGATTLFQNISFVISEGDRIGVIGPNGSGKSTLLGILAGDIEPDSGELSRAQAHAAELRGAGFRFCARANGALRAAIGAEKGGCAGGGMGRPRGGNAGPRGLRGYSTPRLLRYSAAGRNGWQLPRRLALKADVLLLDEPTNHLDLAGIEWLGSAAGRLRSSPAWS